MANFCVECGSPLTTGPFCTSCGTDARSMTQSGQVQPHSPSTQPLHATAAGRHAGSPAVTTLPAPSVPQPASPRNGMSTLAKLGIAAVAIIFVGGAAGAVGVYYVAHRVSQKIHQTADRILGSTSDSTANSDGTGSVLGKSESGRSAESGTMGDVCRLL